mmetsp:Transcript_55527/g.119852  ORF Transcript_55527/g.119852 Transcript_55527/m.119852 type:complete len:85 (-) Transcript_55527:155-409(-)
MGSRCSYCCEQGGEPASLIVVESVETFLHPGGEEKSSPRYVVDVMSVIQEEDDEVEEPKEKTIWEERDLHDPTSWLGFTDKMKL